jgi:serine/threonine-protein kinase RsbW
MTLASNPKNIGRVEGFIKKVDTVIHFDEIQLHKLMISLTEAVNNAIFHGNKSNPEKKVTVKCEILPGWVLFLIADQGSGFRLEHVKNPLEQENLMRENGRGVFLMRTLMDKVEFEQGAEGMEIRLWLDTQKG